MSDKELISYYREVVKAQEDSIKALINLVDILQIQRDQS